MIVKEQIGPNEKVIEASRGMLSPITGDERYISVGCGHTSQFVKATNHCCKTPIKSLQDSHGCIDIVKLKRDPDMKIMCDDGWEWECIPWQAEETWGPELADLFQRALNASHEVASSVSELEVAVSMAECVSDGATDADWDTAMIQAIIGNPPSAAYAPILMLLAKEFGGGVGAPMLVKLDAMAKQYGENRRLGEEFLTAVLKGVFPQDAAFPRIRNGFLACNLTTAKVVDGVARLLTKTDFVGIQSKQKYAKVERCEEILKIASDIADSVVRNVPETESAMIAEEGMFKIRAICFLTGKGSKSFEAIDYKSDTDIIAKFLESITTLLLKHKVANASFLTLPTEWTDVIQQPSTAAQEVAPISKPLTTVEVESKAHILKKKGFEVGKHAVERSVGGKCGIYVITGITDTNVEMLECNIFTDTPIIVKIPFHKFLSGWAPYKGDVPTAVNDKWDYKFIVNRTASDVEVEKCRLFIAIKSYFDEHGSDPAAFFLCLKPSGLRAKVEVAKDELVLVPVAGLSNITTSAGSNNFDLGHKKVIDGIDVKFYMSKPTQPRSEDHTKWHDEDFVNPFFWVTPTSDEKKANVRTRCVECEGVKFNVLVNTRKICRFEEIHTYEPVVQKRKLQHAEIVKPPVDKLAKAK